MSRLSSTRCAVTLAGHPGELERLAVIFEQLSDCDLRHDIEAPAGNRHRAKSRGWSVLANVLDGCACQLDDQTLDCRGVGSPEAIVHANRGR